MPANPACSARVTSRHRAPWRPVNLLAALGLGLGVGLAGSAASAADSEVLRAAVARHLERNGAAMITEFREFLALPNVSTRPADMAVNADWIQSYIARRGFSSRVVSAGGAPYLLAEKTVPGATRTVLIYAHFDGQPVDAANWSTPPFEPTLKAAGDVVDWALVEAAPPDPTWRIHARSAGDDKAPVIALMHALDALDAAGVEPGVNIKLFLDGEEEFGSPTLAGILEAHAEDLNADLMLFCDGPMHQSGRRQLVFGVRGDIGVHLTVYGPARPLHSGHYGNWAPHPTDALLRLLATLKDIDGNILVPGYLDPVAPMTEAEAAAIAAMPPVDAQLRDELALGRVEGGGRRLEELIMQPAINIVGFQAGGIGEQARNIILPTASASLDLRLVKGQTIEHVRRSLEAHIREQGFHIVYSEPTHEERRARPAVIRLDWDGGYPAYRTDLDGPEARRLASILADYEGQAPLLTPTMGGSLPIHLFDQALDMPIVLLPIANHDNNQHGRDENLRLGNLFDAVGVYAAVLANY